MTSVPRIQQASRPSPLTAVEVLETGFYIVALAMMSEALLGPAFGGPPGQPPPSWLQTMWLPVYAILSGLLVLRAPRLTNVWVGGLLALPLIALAFLSIGWSVAPDVTLRRSVALLFTTLLGLQIAARYGWRGLIELFAAVFLLLALGSVVAALLFPSFGVHSELHPGAWRGLWEQKNQLGAHMSKGALACLSAVFVAPQRRRFWGAAAVLCSALVLLSTSTTALLALVLVWASVFAYAAFRKDRGLALIALPVLGGGAILLAALVMFAPELLLQLVGKDATLTGRTDIWQALLRHAEGRRWEGFGYAAFWADKLGPAWYVRRDIGWVATTAHNGWLDLLIQLGWIGLGLFTLHLSVSVFAAARRAFRGDEAPWALLSTAILLLSSVSESTFLQQNNLNWVIYIATTAKLMERHRRPAGSGAASTDQRWNDTHVPRSFAAGSPQVMRAIVPRPTPNIEGEPPSHRA